eukprot:TRINITY_DN46080_c0_g1_i1.p1 TRINITY_DN46080_c0_g1~~TRINITY_DN46080_c0_g1_i1.p1  ORF type:complete len:111 (+),score=3.31 TRINITY_DN46080_c0_g1_i1:135-467(+)
MNNPSHVPVCDALRPLDGCAADARHPAPLQGHYWGTCANESVVADEGLDLKNGGALTEVEGHNRAAPHTDKHPASPKAVADQVPYVVFDACELLGRVQAPDPLSNIARHF